MSRTAASPEPADRIPEQTIFEVLANRRRREILRHLFANRESEPFSKGDLAELIAAGENNTTIEELDHGERKSVLVGLHQTHLPRMEKAGVLEWDEASDEVTLTDRADDVLPYLTAGSEPPTESEHGAVEIARMTWDRLLGRVEVR